MSSFDLRDPDDANRYVLQGLLLARSGPVTPARAEQSLRWAMEIVSDGSPLPPLGFVADVGFVALGTQRSADIGKADPVEGLDHTITRRYEDYVLGKLYADMGFERAGDALLRYSGRDRDRGVAYIVNQQRTRCGFGGAILSPAVIKGLLKRDGEAVCQLAWESVETDQLSPQVIEQFKQLTLAVRNTGELLGPEDIFELESGTALAQFGQRLALRQILQTATTLGQDISKQKPRSQPRQYSVATNIMEEDHYPIGGFTSISNKGTVESMVRSELAYIDPEMRPDLFDIKFARNELLYYSRDENQFLRRRLSYVIVLQPNLSAARFKDDSLPCQRIILLLASIYVAVTQLLEWQSTDAIQFEFLIPHKDGDVELADEMVLLQTLFGDLITSETVEVRAVDPDSIAERCMSRARTSMCHTLSIGCEDSGDTDELSIPARMVLGQAQPTLVLAGDSFASEEVGVAGWKEQLDRLLRFWV